MHQRTRRSNHGTCFEEISLPKCGDFIKVLWIMDHLPGRQNMCCFASLLHVEEYFSTSAIGYGVILYPEGDGSEKQIHEVDFCPNASFDDGMMVAKSA